MGKASTCYHVAPRYTAGSPAMVPESTARRVAAQEQEAYERAMNDRFETEDDRSRAVRLGVQGIVYSTHEGRGKMHVRDLITNEVFRVLLREWGGFWHQRADRWKYMVRVEEGTAI